ncbi:MAG: PilN domain-containing protein [Bradymonadaceae bacterium]
MIRVNLLPIKQARRRSAGRSQLIIFAVLIFLQLATMSVLYMTRADDLGRLEATARQYRSEVDAAKKEVADVQNIESDARRLSEQLAVLTNLEKSRIGPVKMLDELQAMLSRPRNEEDRFAQLQKDWNVEWDTRRLWIQDFSEKERKFDLKGFAGNADDVAEFLQRLTTAEHFGNVQLDVVETTGARGAREGSRMVSFRITGDVSYIGFGSEAAEADAAKKGS